MFARRYLMSFSCAVVISIAIALALTKARQRFSKRYRVALILCLVLLPLAAWVVYFGLTSRSAYTLTLLNSESAQVAESTYYGRFKAEVKTLRSALRLAISEHEAPNVRFYASCLIA